MLLAGYLLSTLISGAIGYLILINVARRWLRLVSMPICLYTFVVCAALGVVNSSRYSTKYLLTRDWDPLGAALNYWNTSGMQMTSLDKDTWFHVTFAATLPMLSFLGLLALASVKGIRGHRHTEVQPAGGAYVSPAAGDPSAHP
jgi:hypothetical protein